MPIEKQSLNNFLPDGFETLNQEGYKENFSEDKIKTGYEKDIKDRVSGPNFNNLIDVVGKNTNTLNNYVEYLNGMPINNVPTVNAYGQLDYTNLDDKLTKKQITNCILEIPQRLKYTLEDGILTIKAGSVVIYPFGTENLTAQYPKGSRFLNDNLKVYDTQYTDGKFFVWAEKVNDASYGKTVGTMENRVLWSNENGTSSSIGLAYCFSGTTAPTGGTTLWYDTTQNIIKRQTDGANWINYQSFPLILGDYTKEVGFNFIREVYNGMGYIGSTLWVDKGIKGLVPDGKNADGTLNNIEYKNKKIIVETQTDTQDYVFRLATNNYLANRQKRYTLTVENLEELNKLDKTIMYSVYVTEENKRYYSDELQWKQDLVFPIFQVTLTEGVISNFKPYQPFRAVDYSDKSTVSSWGMPSSKYIDLTLGASESTYTAPANGWFLVSKNINSGQYIKIYNLPANSTKVMMGACASSSFANFNQVIGVPVKKGDRAQVTYTANGATNWLRFVYAEGEI